MKVTPRKTRKRVEVQCTKHLRKIIVLMDDAKGTAQFIFKNGKLSKPSRSYYLPF